MITVRDAPTKARKLCKSTGYLRKSLSEASKAEQAGTPGAREARETITANFQRDMQSVEGVIAHTHACADASERVALGQHPKSRALRLLAVPEPCLKGIVDLAKHVSSRLRDAADKAQDRIDTHSDDLQATALHALLLSRLPAVKFNISHPSLKALCSEYQSRVEAAKKARK